MFQNSLANKYLCRYTSLPFLLDILRKKRLTFVDPNNWEDKNDSYFIELYKEKSGMKSVLALCFVEYESKDAEKYHHWKVYSGSTSGVCIQFKGDKLISYIDSVPGIIHNTVTYKTVKELRTICQETSWKELPFIKRKAYNGEVEFRIIYNIQSEELKSKPLPIELDLISRITLNPWIHKPDNESVFKVIREIKGCEKIILSNTTLLDFGKWKKIGENIKNAPC